MEGSETSEGIGRRYGDLEKMIKQTSELLEKLVEAQGEAVRLRYAKRTLFLCLVRLNNGNGECCALRWAKYYLNDDARRIWYNGWKPGRVPGSALSRMDPEETAWFREKDNAARELTKLRKDLTSKKKRILGILQSVRQTDVFRLQKLVREIQGFKKSVKKTEIEGEAHLK